MTLDWISLRDAAREELPEVMWRYLEAGSYDELSLGEAVMAWSAYRLAPRVLRDVSRVDLTTSLLGTEVVAPVCVAPTSMQRLAHPDGEVAMAAGVRAAGGLQVVSSNAGRPFAAIGEVGGPWWLQAYLPPEREAILPVLATARAAGARAVVLTVDTPEPGPKRGLRDTWEGLDISWFRCNFDDPAATRWADDIGPGDLGWLSRSSDLPVVVKGVLRADDARRCVDAGAAAVWVSNHGGRQLDRAVSTSAALPAVVDAVGEQAEVYVDGGIRSGLDSLVALALGARAVFLGRPPLWALATGGASGVEALLRGLADDLRAACRLAGAASPEDLRGLVV